MQINAAPNNNKRTETAASRMKRLLFYMLSVFLIHFFTVHL